MTKISIIKSLSDIDNKELFQVYCSSSQKVWSSSDSDNEREDSIDTDHLYNNNSDMLEILSSLVCNLWLKRKLRINTDFLVTGWMLCVIPQTQKNAKD